MEVFLILLTLSIMAAIILCGPAGEGDAHVLPKAAPRCRCGNATYNQQFKRWDTHPSTACLIHKGRDAMGRDRWGKL